jgi:predicted Ser/Thr protein kinase
MSDEKQKQNRLSFTKNEDRILPREDSPIDASEEKSTRHFAESSTDNAQTKIKPAPETEPTEILSDAETETTTILTEIETEVEDEFLPDENALRPSRLRFALVCLLFVIMFIFAGINIYQTFSIQSFPPFITTLQENGFVIVSVRQGFEGAFQVGDELVSVDGTEVNPANIRQIDSLALDEPGERRIIVVRRNEQLREVETVSVPPPLSFRSNRILYGVFLRTIFLITGLLIFLLKPNDKQALLLTLIFVSSLASESLSVLKDLPPILLIFKAIGLLIIIFCAPLFLHFCLVFPERSTLLRRFPNLERLIYLPCLLISLPLRLLLILQFAGYSVFTSFSAMTMFQNVGRYNYDLHFLVGILVLISTYRRSGESARRKLRVSVAGLLCSFLPFLLNGLVLNPLLLAFKIRNPWQEWMPFIVAAPLLLTPLVAAYAIVWDRVIPVSFVIRRGLQYLLAKNVLRLFLILPILGVVWNIAANPNRTLSEILFQNSFAFYFFIVFAVGVGLLMRLRLSVWIDRRFFREQYNQEQVLRELIEAVKESDSLAKLSRLVSSKIQSALHPTSIYLFFQADRNSDFSVGYTTSVTNSNLKLAADSPLLRFMQRESGAIEFPTSQTDDLPNREKRWLREIKANLLVPMHGTDGRLAGIFSLGEKMSQIPYTTRDKELLKTLANQIALVHENLGLKDRMRREQRIKTEVLSRFDEGNINLLKECPHCGRCFDREVEKCTDDDTELTFSLPVERTIENRYRLEKIIGKGGMGAVYQATDLRINRIVAVKILSGSMFGNKDALRRFEREAQTAGRLHHRNIATVFDYGVLSTEGAFLVMEFVRGETLTEVLKRKGRLDAETVIAWFSQVLDGVEAAHKAGIIHRDLKPDNIFVTRNEDETVRLCILDFGLARFNDLELTTSVTVPGTVMGTLGYMPPEQLRGEKTDETSDLFATAVMIYEAMLGERPFAGKTYQEIIQSMNKEIIFDEREPFGKFFERGLAQNAKRRFATTGEMKANLLATKIE